MGLMFEITGYAYVNFFPVSPKDITFKCSFKLVHFFPCWERCFSKKTASTVLMQV